jgi:hypothetical protein
MTRRIARYQTICLQQCALDDKVNKYLDDGWELYGSPFVSNAYIVQTMVFYEQNPF